MARRRLTTLPERRPPTFDLARDACEALFRETGLTPGTDAVVERIGVNNRPLVRKAIEAWLLDLPARLYRREDLPDIPPELAGQFRGLWEAAVQAADQRFAGERAGLQTELDARAAGLTEAQAAQAGAEAQAEAARVELAGQQATAAALEAELAGERETVRATTALLRQAEAEAARRAALLETERGHAAERIAFLEERIDKDNAWYLQRIAEERADARQEAARELARRDEELGRLRLDAARRDTELRALREELAGLKGRGEAQAQALVAAQAALEEKTAALATLAGEAAALRSAQETAPDAPRHAAKPIPKRGWAKQRR
ncbi:replication region DNA-binding N-term [Methylomagnum ishizawai]|uniref:Replication region DNA-binding N-term n=1 Tax=Methylomagnum ishizawai TaxID=1760988 RepID=A0A1Y6DBZ8_9GAMM|nr:DNA-binding protein [Methylomagnum ishizawai]SMF97772.1 replication region DNA-binding N-term [Methylomagnum ishizawai]